jgi:hypothetical protein
MAIEPDVLYESLPLPFTIIEPPVGAEVSGVTVKLAVWVSEAWL